MCRRRAERMPRTFSSQDANIDTATESITAHISRGVDLITSLLGDSQTINPVSQKRELRGEKTAATAAQKDPNQQHRYRTRHKEITDSEWKPTMGRRLQTGWITRSRSSGGNPTGRRLQRMSPRKNNGQCYKITGEEPCEDQHSRRHPVLKASQSPAADRF